MSMSMSFLVSLEGISRFAQTTQHKFTGFFITVEKDQAGVRGEEENVGRFHIAPESAAMSKFSEKCQNLVTHTSSFSKTEILVKSNLM
jgi:Reeler domain